MTKGNAKPYQRPQYSTPQAVQWTRKLLFAFLVLTVIKSC